MNPVVIYSSKSGNTEKVASAISQELGCKVIKLSKEKGFSDVSLEGFDVVFLGCWIRGGEPSPDMFSFLEQLTLDEHKRCFALFLTWAGGGKSDVLAFGRVKQLLETKNQRLLGDCFKCLGKTFGFARRGHPNEQDLSQAKAWARKICEQDCFL